jgi:hypothetical protein
MKNYRLYYLKYKHLLLPSVFVFLSIFLLFFVVLPQITSIGNLTRETSEASSRVQVLKDSLDVLSKQDEAEVESKIGTATNALPTVKDISKIFIALNSAASSADTALREFSLDVGPVHGKAADPSGDQTAAPSMEVRARVEGTDARNLSDFSVALARKFPLAEVQRIDGSGNTASFQVNFFYKPINLSIIAKQDKIPPISASDSDFLNKLEAENNK